MSDLATACQRFMEILEQRLEQGEPEADALAAEELTWAQQHAEECGECGALAGALRVMAAPAPLSAAEHQAFKEAALGGERAAHRHRRQRRVVWALAAALAGVAMGAVIWRFALLPGAPTAPARLELAQPWCGQQQLVAGQVLKNCGEARPLKLRDGSQLRLDGRGVAKLLRADGSERRLRLERGRMTLEVAPAAGRRFVVETAYCEARVLGTLFEVQVMDGDAQVAVVEGTVEVAAQGRAKGEKVQGGWQLRVAKRQRSALSARRKEQIVRALAPTPPPADAAIPTPAKDAMVPDLKAAPPRQKVRVPTLKQLLARARRCRGARDLRCARQSYLALQKHHGAAPVAITSLVALAEVELELGQAKAALQRCRRYLRLRPKGALEREALYAELRALRKLKRRGAEERALKRFLRRFPSSIHASTLRARLKELAP